MLTAAAAIAGVIATKQAERRKVNQQTLRMIPRVLLPIAFVLGLAFLSSGLLSRYAVGVHQHAVAAEIDEWANEYSMILNDGDAVHSAEMLDYIARYYLPSEGYRSFESNENALLQSRRRAIDRITNALHAHTGVEFGNDTKAWSDWAKDRRADVANNR